MVFGSYISQFQLYGYTIITIRIVVRVCIEWYTLLFFILFYFVLNAMGPLHHPRVPHNTTRRCRLEGFYDDPE